MEKIKILQRVAELERDRYKKTGDYSVTDIISPPRIVHLRKRYGDDVDQPLSSVVPAMVGTAIHDYFEKYLKLWIAKHNYTDYVLEEEVATNVTMGKGETRKISGRYDIRDGLDLYDLKTCKTWKLIFDPGMIEWTEQQNLYNYLLWCNGVTLDSINVVAVYKDWQVGYALRDKSYPQEQIMEYKLNKWPMTDTKKFMWDKLKVLVANEDVEDGALPQCTREERWERFSGGHQVEYAIMKSAKAKRAARVIKTNLDDAYAWANAATGITPDSFIEVRYAKRTRCEDYCAVNKHCKSYQQYIKAKKNDTLNDFLPIKM
jgi:hypothetical protein